jgi:hypothetical protein
MPRRGVNQHPSGATRVERPPCREISRSSKRARSGTHGGDRHYDENGGFWDHVAPPRDRWARHAGAGIVVSPFAKRGVVDHTPDDTTSIPRPPEARFGLAPLTDADAKANIMIAPFQF